MMIPNTLDLPTSVLKGIDDIPLDRRKNICTSIDYSIARNDGYWDQLVKELGFNETDSKNFQLAFPKNQSPTENLLRECSYRNYKICLLVHVMKKIGLVKLAEENLENIDNNHVQPLSIYLPHAMPPLPMMNKPRPSESKESRRAVESDSSSSTHSATDSDKIGGLDTIHFSYEDIVCGTDNFSHDMKLGAGAFGKVYKVKLKNTTYACKVLTMDNDNQLTFSIVSKHREHSDLRNELRYLAEYRHPNIIPLYGWSLDGKDPCLIYQFMKNGSLQDCLQRLKSPNSLEWPTRVKVACDAARGLQFLHEAKDKPLIHGDIKTANILLDESFVAKLGDFGLAREGPRSAVTGSYIKLGNEHTPGTIGYLAKEYLDSKKLSVQVDTYAFGVVLLELYTGRRAYDRSQGKATLLRDYMEDIADGRGSGGVENANNLLVRHQDPEIKPLLSEIALDFVKFSLECCHVKRIKRPTMLRTLNHLEKIRDTVELSKNYDYNSHEGAVGLNKDFKEVMSHESQMGHAHNLDRQKWLTIHTKKQNQHQPTHVLSQNPVESVDDSLSLMGDRDPSLPHADSNIYSPQDPSDIVSLSKQFDMMRMGSMAHHVDPVPGARANKQGQMLSDYSSMESLRHPPQHDPGPVHYQRPPLSMNPGYMQPHVRPNLELPHVMPSQIHPYYHQQHHIQDVSNHMSPVFTMWPQMSPGMQYPPYYTSNFMPQNPHFYPQFYHDNQMMKLASANEGGEMVEVKANPVATTPVSPNNQWPCQTPDGIVCTPEAFTSLDLEPTYVTSPITTSPQLSMDRSLYKNSTNYMFASVPQFPYHPGPTPHFFPSNPENHSNGVGPAQQMSPPHKIEVNNVKSEMLDRINVYDNYSQIFRSSPK